MRVRFGAVEDTENIILSRSVCYAMLAALVIGLFILANATPSPHSWLPSPSEQGPVATQGSLFDQIVASVRVSTELLRDRLHNTWLFLFVFLGGWAIVLTWGLLERRRLKLGVGRREVYWMGWMSLSVITTAILYGIGTNGILARRYPKVVPVSDVLALGFVLALPVFAWNRLQRRRLATGEADQLTPVTRRLYSTLGLDDDEGRVRPRSIFQEQWLQPTQEGIPLQSFQMPTPDAGTIAAMDRLMESTVLAVRSQSQMVSGPSPELPALAAPAAEAAPSSLETAPGSLDSAPASSPESFREHLRTLNEAWERIERTGREIEQWFDQQRLEVVARLEKHPGVRQPGAPAPLSRDFLNEKLAAVDTEWAAIRRATLEISRWFGDAPAAKG